MLFYRFGGNIAVGFHTVLHIKHTTMAYHIWHPRRAASFWSARYESIKRSLVTNYVTVSNVLLGISWGIFREMVLLGMSWHDCLDLRFVGLLFDLLFTRFYVALKCHVFKQLKIAESNHFFGPGWWQESTLFMCFWTGVYTLNIGFSFLVGLNVLENTSFFNALALFAPGAFMAGRPFGWVMYKLRLVLERYGLLVPREEKKSL